MVRLENELSRRNSRSKSAATTAKSVKTLALTGEGFVYHEQWSDIDNNLKI